MPRGTKVSKERKRKAIAGALVDGKGPKAIAKQIGCADSHVRRIAAEPETGALIQRIMAPHRAKLAKMAKRAVEAVDQALVAQRTDKADHQVRMRAVGRYGDLLELTEGGKRHDAAGESGGGFTLEQALELLQLTKGTHDDSATKPR